MNEELLGLLGATPEQIAQARQRSGFEELGLLGQALMQAGAPAPRGTSTLGRLGQAAGAYTQAPRQTMDTLLQDLLRKQQVQDLQRKRQQEQAQMAAMQQISAGLTPEQQQLATAFGPDVLRNIVMPTQEAFTLGEGQRRFIGDREVAAVPKPETLTNEYQNFLKAKEGGFTGSFLDYQAALKAAGRTQVTATATAGGAKDLTPGQKRLDEKAADDIFQWQSGGGQDMAAQIAQLKPVIADLEAGKPITGISVAVQPDLLLAMTNPRALQNREAVEEVVQRNLRVILGAQFTEKEGERLISRAFNPKLPPAENAKRVRRLFLQMETAAQQKQAMADYFNENGTLKGFQGKMPSVRDFENAMESGAAAPSVPSGVTVKRIN
jgi:hypothetical protein